MTPTEALQYIEDNTADTSTCEEDDAKLEQAFEVLRQWLITGR